jgi:hypothetical protein
MTERPTYNRLVNEEFAHDGFAGDDDNTSGGTSSGGVAASSTVTDNPFLTALVSLGAVTLLVGIVLSALGVNVYIGSERVVELAAVGVWLTGAGVALLTAWLAASAVCWQLRQSRAEPPR